MNTSSISIFLIRKTKSNCYTIVHFLPVFGCLGDYAWNCIPTVYSVVMGSSFFSNQDVQLGEWSRACVCGGSARDHSRGWKVEFRKNRQSQNRDLNIGIQFQANSRSSQILGGRFFCILTPLVNSEIETRLTIEELGKGIHPLGRNWNSGLVTKIYKWKIWPLYTDILLYFHTAVAVRNSLKSVQQYIFNLYSVYCPVYGVYMHSIMNQTMGWFYFN